MKEPWFKDPPYIARGTARVFGGRWSSCGSRGMIYLTRDRGPDNPLPSHIHTQTFPGYRGWDMGGENILNLKVSTSFSSLFGFMASVLGPLGDKVGLQNLKARACPRIFGSACICSAPLGQGLRMWLPFFGASLILSSDSSNFCHGPGRKGEGILNTRLPFPPSPLISYS